MTLNGEDLMATQVEQESGREWKPVPPGHPDRPAFEAEMRAMGITPATVWDDRPGRVIVQRSGWLGRLRARFGF
jgi:hypothetical protein